MVPLLGLGDGYKGIYCTVLFTCVCLKISIIQHLAFCFALFFFVFFTKTGKSKMQEAESDPALFLLEIFPTVIHGLHAGTLTIIQNACWESGCKRRENAWFHAK